MEIGLIKKDNSKVGDVSSYDKLIDAGNLVSFGTTFIVAAAKGQEIMQPMAKAVGRLGKVTGIGVLTLEAIQLRNDSKTTAGDWTKLGVDGAAYLMTNTTDNGYVVAAGIVIGFANTFGVIDPFYNAIDNGEFSNFGIDLGNALRYKTE